MRSLKITALAAALTIVIALGAPAGQKQRPAMVVYDVSVFDVYDGDTFWVRWEIPGSYARTDRRVRLLGVDTPEINGRCAAEKDLAVAAREFVREQTAAPVTMEIYGTDKYGRTLVRIITHDGGDLSDRLLAQGLGRIYTGGKRLPWCPEED